MKVIGRRTMLPGSPPAERAESYHVVEWQWSPGYEWEKLPEALMTPDAIEAEFQLDPTVVRGFIQTYPFRIGERILDWWPA